MLENIVYMRPACGDREVPSYVVSENVERVTTYCSLGFHVGDRCRHQLRFLGARTIARIRREHGENVISPGPYWQTLGDQPDVVPAGWHLACRLCGWIHTQNPA